jgi:hypothetical protein
VRKLVPLMNGMLCGRLKKLAERTPDTELRGRLLQFAEVLVPDGCGFKIAGALSGVYAGTGTDRDEREHVPEGETHRVQAGHAV